MNFPFVNIIHNFDDKERGHVLEKELSRTGLSAMRWEAVMTIPSMTGIIKSHKRIVEWARENNQRVVTVAENDFYFPAGERGVKYYFDNIPDDYDIYLAGIYVGRDKLPGPVKQFSGMHFYMVHSRFYDTFLEMDESQSIDNQLSALARIGVAKIECCWPMAAIQHENISSTSGCVFKHKYFFNHLNVYGLQ